MSYIKHLFDKVNGVSRTTNPDGSVSPLVTKQKYENNGIITATSTEQEGLEQKIMEQYRAFVRKFEIDCNTPVLNKASHINFLKSSLFALPASYTCLDCSRTWMCYWIIHSLNLLGHELDQSEKSAVIHFLKRCQHKNGGFGGGPGQFPHLACTYAAVNALCSLRSKEAYDAIDREKLRDFLWTLKFPSGGFAMELGGEVDIRGVYCAVAVATLTNLNTVTLFLNSAEWVTQCQTYEGGFGGFPGTEAHGGYSFCGIASLIMLSKIHLCNVEALMRWTLMRQLPAEGGFQGRTNKLVDSCYSFWQGAIVPIILMHIKNPFSNYQNVLSVPVDTAQENDDYLFNRQALQEYLLICCQHESGGLVDKPGRQRDLYHSCYALSGLSLAQHSNSRYPFVIGHPDNLLNPIHAVYNLELRVCTEALLYFSGLPSV